MGQPISGFEDKVDIGATLVEPKDHGEYMSDQIAALEGLFGGVDDAWQWLFGWSLWEWLFVRISGNWGELRSLSEGWAALAEASDGVSTNLSGFTGELRESWQGRAAEAFAGYMGEWNGSLAAEKAMCEDMSSAIGDIADHAEAALNQMLSGIELIVDIVFFALKAASLAKALKRANDALGKAHKLKEVVEQLLTVVDSFVYFCESFRDCLEEANDNNPSMPNGEVGVPDEPGATEDPAPPVGD